MPRLGIRYLSFYVLTLLNGTASFILLIFFIVHKFIIKMIKSFRHAKDRSCVKMRTRLHCFLITFSIFVKKLKFILKLKYIRISLALDCLLKIQIKQ